MSTKKRIKNNSNKILINIQLLQLLLECVLLTKTKSTTLASPFGRGVFLLFCKKTERASTLHLHFSQNVLPSLSSTNRASASLPPLYSTKLSYVCSPVRRALTFVSCDKSKQKHALGLTSASMKITESAFICVFSW